jgi:hypothetical protein
MAESWAEYPAKCQNSDKIKQSAENQIEVTLTSCENQYALPLNQSNWIQQYYRPSPFSNPVFSIFTPRSNRPGR